jgi:RsiW-degrading membrane proteinase PrsW (M82 family)
MEFIAAFLPVFIYLEVVYSIDRFSLISLRRLLHLVLCGVLAAVICFGIFRLVTFSSQISTFTNPLVEELVKALPLIALAQRKKIVFFIDSVICGAAVGAGFCMVENLLYLFGGEPMGFGTALFRGLEVALVHMGCSAIVAAGLMFAVRIVERRRAKLELKQKDVWMTVLLLLSAPLLHILHNAVLTVDFQSSVFNFQLIQLAVVFALMGGLLAWTWDYDSRMIHRWIDRGLDKQLELILAIREGRFDQTPTGKYLLAVKDSFPQEVFFDLVCYVQLHTELLIAAKSRFMAREAGVNYKLDEERRRALLSKHEEYRELERHIGSTARMAVAPLLKHYPADRKALADLMEECGTPKQ